MGSPTLTVVMPVFNGEKYLNDAISSVLNQTFTDFEFIIINDGSIDSSLDIIKSFDDERIILINNEKNNGIPFCRNLGLELAKGAFLTWTDCDDLNEPTRFEEQINFLNANKKFGVCGTSIKRFGDEEYDAEIYTDPELVKATLFFKPSIPNATAMLRMAKIKEHNLKYDVNLPIAEDYDFIFRCSLLFPVTNLDKILYRYRASETSIMAKYLVEITKNNDVQKIVNKKILNSIGIIPSNSELVLHRSISSPQLFGKRKDYTMAFQWLILLKKQNKDEGLYNEEAFKKVLADQMYFISKKASQLGLWVFSYYIRESYQNFGLVSHYKIFKLFVRCLIKYNRF